MESFVLEIGIYLLTGAIVGFAAGLLGIGGGLIIVPVLTSALVYFTQSEHVVHMAIATSLATIIITSISSVRAHHQHNAVRWDVVKMLVFGVLAGAFIGGWASQYLSGKELAIVFGTLELLIAINMLLALKPNPSRSLPGYAGNTAAGTVIGSFSSIVGIGGGTLTTPYLVWNNISMHHAIATSTAVSVPVAIAGTAGYVLAGLNADNLPAYSIGYIYLPAFLGIIASSIFFAPLGAKLAHRLDPKLLKRFLGVILLGLAAKMLVFS